MGSSDDHSQDSERLMRLFTNNVFFMRLTVRAHEKDKTLIENNCILTPYIWIKIIRIRPANGFLRWAVGSSVCG